MSCGVVCRRSLDPVLLWLWHRPTATAPIGPLAWEPPYASGVALEKAKGQKKKGRVHLPLPAALGLMNLFGVAFRHQLSRGCISLFSQTGSANTRMGGEGRRVVPASGVQQF